MALTDLLVIVGPTASGKSRLAVQLARRYGGEVVSCDSMQVYRGMNIGTAKPTPEDMEGVPHHMIDVVGPSESFSVADFAALAREAVADIARRGRLPVLAGGTGLYVSALTDNTDFSRVKGDPRLREELRALAQREGGERLLAMLAPLDAQTAARLHPNDTGRIIRAIELCSTTGTTMAQIAADSHAQPPQYRLCMIGLGCEPRGKLYARIDARVDRMLAQGLREEVRALLESGVRPDATSMQAIGYKELVGCLEGRETLGEAAETIKRETRRYAKRQLTWFRRDARIHWIDIFSLSDDKIYQNACETIEKYGFVCYNTSEPPEKPGSAAQWNE